VELRETEFGVTLGVHVKVRAGRTQVLGVKADALSVALAAAPVDGAANDALREALADYFDIAKSQVRIVSGEKSRHKVIALGGLSAETVRARLAGTAAR
jgi:uncharacterized protein